jgi:hypothetical protein
MSKMKTKDLMRTLIGLLEVANEKLQEVNALHKREIERLRSGIRRYADTLVSWAALAGGRTPSAIIASRIASGLRQLVGDEPIPPPIDGVECDVSAADVGGSGSAANWIVNDITIGDRSQFVQSGALPGDMFVTTAIDSYVTFETAQTATDVVMIVTYQGATEGGN